MSNVTIKDSLAKIALSKNLIKEYKTPESERTVYLDNGTEFQIYLKNPYQTHLGIKIYVNDKSIGNMLVLKPGQSHWLDRYIDSDDRFLFSTYEIENSAEMRYATAKNGKIKIEFYHEQALQQGYVCKSIDNDWITTLRTDIVDPNLLRFSTTCDSISTSPINAVNSTTTSSNSSYVSYTGSIDSVKTYCNSNVNIDKTATNSISPSIETGRIEKGSKSNQNFSTCFVNFEYLPFETETIQILPNSRKQIRAEETRRKYCSNCGKKVSPKDKYCSNCGSKLQ